MTLVHNGGRCRVCNAPTVVTADQRVHRPHLTWCRRSRPDAPSRTFRDPYTVPGSACFVCGGPTRGGEWCSTCRRITLNAIKEKP